MDAAVTPDIILKLSNIESYYGPIMAIRGISLEVPRAAVSSPCWAPTALARPRC
ncbi:ABC-type sugar transport system ATPase subunit [Bradyrhizobium sp. LM2.3]